MNFCTYISLSTLFLFSCASKNNEKQNYSTTAQTSKAERIHDLIKEVGFIELPHKTNFNDPTDDAYKIEKYDKDSVLAHDFGTEDIYVVGSLPDTSNYYAFVYLTVAANSIPNLITFDKTGKLISKLALTEEYSASMGGNQLEIEEYAIIDKDLKILSYYKSIIEYETAIVDVYDTVCTHYETNGEISPNGEIIVGPKNEFKCTSSFINNLVPKGHVYDKHAFLNINVKPNHGLLLISK